MAFQYHVNRSNGDFNFVPNPFALTGAVMLSNISNSSYNALQVEVRRRMPGSLQFQGSYTFSKVLTDSGGRPIDEGPVTFLGLGDRLHDAGTQRVE